MRVGRVMAIRPERRGRQHGVEEYACRVGAEHTTPCMAESVPRPCGAGELAAEEVAQAVRFEVLPIRRQPGVTELTESETVSLSLSTNS